MMINENRRFVKTKEVVKGEVYWAKIPRLEGSHIQSGVRPVIIWCNQKAGIYSPVVQYVPVTSQTEKMRRKKLPVQVLLNEKCPFEDSVALVEQLGCIDKSRLMGKIGTLSSEDMFKIKKAVMVQEGFDIYETMQEFKQFAYA